MVKIHSRGLFLISYQKNIKFHFCLSEIGRLFLSQLCSWGGTATQPPQEISNGHAKERHHLPQKCHFISGKNLLNCT